MIAAKRIDKPDQDLVRKILSITGKQHLTRKKDFSKGFLVTMDYTPVLASASYVYVDDADDPTYISIFYTPEDYRKRFGEPPVKELENMDFNYVTVKNPDKKTSREQYVEYFNSMSEEEKLVSPEGFWGEIAESIDDNISNKSSKAIHLSLGLKKVYEYTRQKKSLLSGKEIKWGVYVKTFS